MAHKTLIGGTAYEISGGKALVGGTAYEIDKGKTLVGGTAYEVGFDDGMREVGITVAMANTQYASVTIDGVVYGGTMTPLLSIRVPVGTAAICKAKGSYSQAQSSINLNGTAIKSGTGTAECTYNYVINGNVKFAISGSGTLSFVNITEQ